MVLLPAEDGPGQRRDAAHASVWEPDLVQGTLFFYPHPQPSLFSYPFLGFHFYSLGHWGGGKGVNSAWGSLWDCWSTHASGSWCRTQTRSGNNSRSVIWLVASRTLGHSSHVSIITTGR